MEIRKVFLPNEDEKKIDVYTITYEDKELYVFLDEVTKKIGCKYLDKSSNLTISNESEKRDLIDARRVLIKAEYQYYLQGIFGKMPITIPELYRYYFGEDPFVIAIDDCHKNNDLELIHFASLYKYLRENEQTPKINEYLIEYGKLLNIDLIEQLSYNDFSDKNNELVKEINTIIRIYKESIFGYGDKELRKKIAKNFFDRKDNWFSGVRSDILDVSYKNQYVLKKTKVIK